MHSFPLSPTYPTLPPISLIFFFLWHVFSTLLHCSLSLLVVILSPYYSPTTNLPFIIYFSLYIPFLHLLPKPPLLTHYLNSYFSFLKVIEFRMSGWPQPWWPCWSSTRTWWNTSAQDLSGTPRSLSMPTSASTTPGATSSTSRTSTSLRTWLVLVPYRARVECCFDNACLVGLRCCSLGSSVLRTHISWRWTCSCFLWHPWWSTAYTTGLSLLSTCWPLPNLQWQLCVITHSSTTTSQTSSTTTYRKFVDVYIQVFTYSQNQII